MIFCLVLLKWTCIPDLILAHIAPLPHRLESLKPKPLWKVNISLALPYYPPDGQLNVGKRELDSIAAGEEIGREREEVMLARIDD
jgi:hypothetical protein